MNNSPEITPNSVPPSGVRGLKEQIQEGIPKILPLPKPFEANINHAPKRKEILTAEERFAMRFAILSQSITQN